MRAASFRARELRASSTPAEQALWKLLRDRRLQGIKFRRQSPLGIFVADFYCPELKLVIELDGEIVREEAAGSGLSEAVVEDYLRHALHFELNAGDLDGLRLFYRLAVEEGLLERERPIEYAPAS